MKSIVLCADDYGISTSVSAAIRKLADIGRISAVSCMSAAPDWPVEAGGLKPFRNMIDIGLHFSLTSDFEKSDASLSSWIWNGISRRIDQKTVKRKLQQQLDLFESVWESPPDFVDGHQHVHVFPGIRDTVVRVLAERYGRAMRPWIRRVNPTLIGHDALTKAIALRILSAGFSRCCKRADLTLSGDFLGLYSLSERADFPGMVSGWLRRARPGSLMMCHPGLVDLGDPDGLGHVRWAEFSYLQGDEFGDLLRKEGVELVRFFGIEPSL